MRLPNSVKTKYVMPFPKSVKFNTTKAFDSHAILLAFMI